MTSRLDREFERLVHLDGPDAVTVDHDIVWCSTDLGPDCLMRQFQRCRHVVSPLVFARHLSVLPPRHLRRGHNLRRVGPGPFLADSHDPPR